MRPRLGAPSDSRAEGWPGVVPYRHTQGSADAVTEPPQHPADDLPAPPAAPAGPSEPSEPPAVDGSGAAALPPLTGRAPTREYRTMVGMWITAVFGIVILVLGATFAGPALAYAPLAVFAILASIAVNVVEAVGLNGRAPWARYAMTAMCWIALIVGLVGFVIALTRSTLNVPVGSILAGWALAAQPDASLGPVPSASTEGLLLVLASLALAILPFLGPF